MAHSKTDATDATDNKKRRDSQADALVDLGTSLDLFHDPAGDGFATIEIDGHFETHRLRTRGFRRWLARQHYQKYQKAPGAQAVQDALTVIEGIALFDGPEHSVHTRLAQSAGTIYIDVGDEQWQVVSIDATGWSIVDHAPIKFIRGRGMMRLPLPVRGGSLRDLRTLLNLADDNSWALVQGFLVGALQPTSPYPLLVGQGDQGSSKTTLSRMLKATIDPSAAPVRSEPRDVRDLVIAASSSRLLAFDNLSYLSPALSDALCRLSTGGGFATRELYTDTDEIILDVQRPVIVNGIEEIVTRPDLLDRAIILELPAIPDGHRKPESELWAQFDAILPGVLGALYQAVSVALRDVDSIRLPTLPRLADFALWAVAAEPALDMRHGAFLIAYNANRKVANQLTLGAAIIAEPLLALLERQNPWSGTATALLDALSERVEYHTTRAKSWPQSPQALSNQLRRITSNLRTVGVKVEFFREGREGRRMILLKKTDPLDTDDEDRTEQVEETSSAPSAASALTQNRPVQAGNATRAADGADDPVSTSNGNRQQELPNEYAYTSRNGTHTDAADAADDVIHHNSNELA